MENKNPVEKSNRIVAIDVLRGFALLGILGANIMFFDVEESYLQEDWSIIIEDLAVGASSVPFMIFTGVFVMNKMMAVFSMLFGAGIILMTERIEERGASSRSVHYTRNFLLLGIGIFHYNVLWFGDVLMIYAVSAFLRQALRPNGNLGFCCWREKSENDWINLPYQAIRPCLPEQPEEDPFAPGPFAFARHEYVFEMLGQAGFSGIQIIPCDVSLSFGPSKDIQAAVKELTLTGPLAKLMADLSADVRAMAFDSVVTALEPHYQDGTVTLSGALWLVMAKN